MNDDETLDEARTRFFEAIKKKGMHCPLCTRWGKINPQHLDASKARALLWLRSRHLKRRGQWVHCATEGPHWLVGKNMFSTMKYWGLVEAAQKDPEDTKAKTSGLWRITERGMVFAMSRSTEPKTAWIYNDLVQDFSEARVRIQDCIRGFNYEEMMNHVFNDRDTKR